MLFTKEKNGKYKVSDVKSVVDNIKNKINEAKIINVEYVPAMFFKYKGDSGVITLGCTDLMSNQNIPDPDGATIEMLTEIISTRIINMSVFERANHIWIHDISLIPTAVPNGENDTYEVQNQIEVMGFIKLKDDYFEKYLENEVELNERQKQEREKAIKNLEEKLNAAKRSF